MNSSRCVCVCVCVGGGGGVRGSVNFHTDKPYKPRTGVIPPPPPIRHWTEWASAN